METQIIKVLWAVKIGDPDYAEQVITADEEQIAAASEWAIAQGFDRLRIAEIDLHTPPNFANTIDLPTRFSSKESK